MPRPIDEAALQALPPPKPPTSGPVPAYEWNPLVAPMVVATVVLGVIGALVMGPIALRSISSRGGRGRGVVIGLMCGYSAVAAIAVTLLVLVRPG